MDGAFNVQVILGAHNVIEDGISVASDEFATHEGWDPNTLENDVAWIKLPEPVTLSKLVNVFKKMQNW